MQTYNKSMLETILRQMLGNEFITFFIIDLPRAKQVTLFVKTSKEFVWGDKFDDDPAWDYLEECGYTSISIIATKELKGGEWYGYEG